MDLSSVLHAISTGIRFYLIPIGDVLHIRLARHRRNAHTGNIMLRIRTFGLVLIMLGLPLQGVLAAIMPLCAQAKNVAAAGPGTQIPSVIIPSAACTQHDGTGHEPSVDNDGTLNEANFSLSCDGVVCHISGNALLPSASLLNLAGGHSYAISSDCRFTSSFPHQPQRPPLA